MRFSTVHEAEWLAATIDRLAQIGKFAGCPGHRNEVIPVFQFYDSFDTNHGKTVAGIMCHAEYLDGPYRGGCWYCQVVSGGTQFFHTAETAITPRSGLAAMWLCEVVISAVLSDVWQRGPTHCWQDSH
ncbi:MAG: hypothetical protein R3B84_20120 [Zavarzinella sp.]